MSDKIEVVCPNCQRLLKVPASAAGKRGRCPRCQNEFPIEPVVMLDPSTEVVAPQAPNAFDGSLGAPTGPFGQDDPFGASSWPAAPAAANQFPHHSGATAPLPPMPGWAPAPSSPPAGVANEYLASAQRDLVDDRQKKRQEAIHGAGGGTSAGIIGGIVAMVLAVVWFVAGLFANRIFFYPPIMFVCGLVAVIKGIAGLADDR